LAGGQAHRPEVTLEREASRTPPPGRDYTKFLKADGLKGARIGIPRAFYYDKFTPPGATEARGGLNAEQTKVMSCSRAGAAPAHLYATSLLVAGTTSIPSPAPRPVLEPSSSTAG
jgi:hypothetical protein